MNCKHSMKQAKEYYEEHTDDYYVARNDAFVEFITEKAQAYAECSDEPLDSIEFAESITEVFEFKTIEDWLTSEYEGMLGDCADQAYELHKDRLMGLDD